MQSYKGEMTFLNKIEGHMGLNIPSLETRILRDRC